MTHQLTQWNGYPMEQVTQWVRVSGVNPAGHWGKPNGSGVMTQRVGEFPKVMTQWGKTRRFGDCGDRFTFRAGKAKNIYLFKKH
jgi:hypothetical protein